MSGSARPRTRTIGLGARAGETGGSLQGFAELRINYALEYTSTVSRVITELKYGDKPGLAGVLAPFMNSAIPDALPQDTAVVPVPLHPSRRRERGYNQSELLAASVARIRGLSLERGVLLKTRNTGSQTELEREERIKNVEDSFGLRRPGRLSGRRVLLVDDVVTTGSTLKECARAILESGAMEVSACVAASSL
jgi:ComF family protein